MRSSRQAGLTLIETLVALMVLGLAILMSAAVVAWANRLETRIERRAVALDLASGILEGVRAAGAGEARRMSIDADSLPGGQAVVLVESQDEELALQRVTVSVTWTGRDAGEVRLVTVLGPSEIYK